MGVLIDELTEKILALPRDERVILVERLSDSLVDLHEDDHLGDAWREVIRRRMAEVESGEVELIDGATGFQRVRDALRK